MPDEKLAPPSQPIEPESPELHHHAQQHLGSVFGAVAVATVFHITTLYTAHSTILIILTHAALSFYIAHHLVRAHSTWQVATIIGGFSGAIAAGSVALYTLVVSFNIVGVFSLITQTVFTGVLDSIAAGFLFLILQLIKPKLPVKPYDSDNQTK